MHDIVNLMAPPDDAIDGFPCTNGRTSTDGPIPQEAPRRRRRSSFRSSIKRSITVGFWQQCFPFNWLHPSGFHSPPYLKLIRDANKFKLFSDDVVG
jgi:hypothetical protein